MNNIIAISLIVVFFILIFCFYYKPSSKKSPPRARHSSHQPPVTLGPEVASTQNLCEMLEVIENEDLKKIIILQIKKGISHEQYHFLNNLTTEYLSYLMDKCAAKNDKIVLKISKMDWINKEK